MQSLSAIRSPSLASSIALRVRTYDDPPPVERASLRNFSLR
jgi:hypothetical protein